MGVTAISSGGTHGAAVRRWWHRLVLSTPTVEAYLDGLVLMVDDVSPDVAG